MEGSEFGINFSKTNPVQVTYIFCAEKTTAEFDRGKLIGRVDWPVNSTLVLRKQSWNFMTTAGGRKCVLIEISSFTMKELPAFPCFFIHRMHSNGRLKVIV